MTSYFLQLWQFPFGDNIKSEIRLPEEKLQQLETLLRSWEGNVLYELDSLIGQLQHATNVIKAGYLRQMIVLGKPAKNPQHQKKADLVSMVEDIPV